MKPDEIVVQEQTSKPVDGESVFNDGLERLLPCPFCGGEVMLESTLIRRSKEFSSRKFWGVVCRNMKNLGGSCAMEQVPSASKEAAIDRWNMRNGVRSNVKLG